MRVQAGRERLSDLEGDRDCIHALAQGTHGRAEEKGGLRSPDSRRKVESFIYIRDWVDLGQRVIIHQVHRKNTLALGPTEGSHDPIENGQQHLTGHFTRPFCQ
jgi:hypothetical protein